MTLLQWTRYMKTIRDREETKGTTKKHLHMCFGAVGLQPFLVFCVFCLLQKHCFSPGNRLFCSFLSVSLSFSLASFTFPFSLSVSLVSCFFLFIPCFLVDFSFLVFLLFFLALFLCVCFTKKDYIWKASFHQLFLFFGFSCFVLSFKSLFSYFVSFVLSVVCFGQHKCFQFSKKTITKTLSFVSHILQSYRFFKGPIWGQIWVMFEKHCKNRHFSTGLRASWSKQIRFSGWRV